MKLISLFIFVLSCMLFPQTDYPGQKESYSINYKLTPEENEFLDTLQYRSFLYFLGETNHENGFVKDRSTEKSPSSIAASGFGIAAWAIGAEREWISRKEAAQLTLNLMRFFMNSEQSADALATGFKGLYYHFLDMKTGERFWECELSTIDTALLFAGMIFARQYYNQDDPVEAEIRDLAGKLINRAEWDFFILPDTSKYASVLNMDWKPEKGYGNGKWIGYNEALILYIIAAGSGTERIEKGYQTWLSFYKWMEPYPDLAHVVFPPLFGHQYSHMFVDFRGLADSYMKEKEIDYFENSRRATLTQRLYAIDNPLGWKGYDSLTWGLTACDGPGEKYNFENRKFHTYAARGTSGPGLVHFDDGTFAPTAAGGSIVFAPEIVIPTLISIYERYGAEDLWGPYGFYDAFNPTLNWVDPDYLGIDQGPIVIMIENFRTGLIWKYAMKDPLIQEGLVRLGFTGMESD